MNKRKQKPEKPLDWAIRQLEEIARKEKRPELKALWLRAIAVGYDHKSKGTTP